MEIVGEFVAGWFAGCAGVVVAQPMDTVKVRMQVLTSGSRQGVARRSAFSCFVNIVKHETVFGLYKGIVPPLLAVALQNAVLFGVYGNVLSMLSTKEGAKPSLAHICVAGAASGAAQVWIVCPMELIKIKLQMQTRSKKTRSPSYHGVMDHIRNIYKTAGIRGFCQGGTSVLLRDVPGFVTYFAAYEILIDSFTRESRDDLGPLTTMFAGGFAGMIAWASTFPFDVIKSRMQADGTSGKFKYAGLTDCIVKDYRTGGLRIFFSGLGPTLLRAFPTNAVIFSVYSLVSRAFSRDACTALTTETSL